jgi:hypothetical protein
VCQRGRALAARGETLRHVQPRGRDLEGGAERLEVRERSREERLGPGGIAGRPRDPPARALGERQGKEVARGLAALDGLLRGPGRALHVAVQQVGLGQDRARAHLADADRRGLQPLHRVLENRRGLLAVAHVQERVAQRL